MQVCLCACMCVCACVGELNNINLTAFRICCCCCCCLSSLMRWADGHKAFTVAFRRLRSLLLLLLRCFDPLSRRMSHKAECQLNLPCPLCPTKASTPRRSCGESRQQTSESNEWAERTYEWTNVRRSDRTSELTNARNNNSSCWGRIEERNIQNTHIQQQQ